MTNFRLIGHRKIVIGMLYLATLSTAHATGILDLYRQARLSDPQFASAKADWDAIQTLVPQAYGQLLPQLSFSGSRIDNDTTNDRQIGRSGRRSTDYSFLTKSASLNLSMALFRPQIWASYLQSQAQVKQADGQLRLAGYDLILRLAQAYFDALLAEDNLAFSREQKAAISEQLKQARRYFEAGVGTITDINETQARFDTITAQELAAEGNLEIKYRALEQITGIAYKKVDRLGAQLLLEQPEPRDVDRWLEVSLANNPGVNVREAAMEAAQQDVYKNFAAHLPTVDIVASRGRSENPSYTTIDEVNWSNTVGLQVSVPIFSGGTTAARTNQASANKERARYDLETAKRAAIQNTRQEFINITNGVAQVKALGQAVKSNELALYSAKKGQEAGIRTSFDVLNAQQLVFQAKRDLAQERYRYVLSRLKLRANAGLLGEEDVELVEQWLDK